ncbi:MAG TPA: histidine phosphatase family protein [Vicinamibacterales bacterium]|nr:histidine phosphatase family protein [Vicinamibacterales bacterium]
MKRLLILRHAKSSWADSSQADWQRPLNARGVRDAPRVGEWLRERAIVPDVIITSDAIRARTTAEAVATAAGYTRDIITEPSIYNARPEDLLEVVTRVGDDARIALLVGHNPGLEDLIHQLTGQPHGMGTAAIVALDLAIDRWSDLDSGTSASIVETWQPGGD